MNTIKKKYETPQMVEVRMAGRGVICMERSHLLANSGEEVYSKKRRNLEEEADKEKESLW